MGHERESPVHPTNHEPFTVLFRGPPRYPRPTVPIRIESHCSLNHCSVPLKSPSPRGDDQTHRPADVICPARSRCRYKHCGQYERRTRVRARAPWQPPRGSRRGFGRPPRRSRPRHQPRRHRRSSHARERSRPHHRRRHDHLHHRQRGQATSRRRPRASPTASSRPLPSTPRGRSRATPP